MTHGSRYTPPDHAGAAPEPTAAVVTPREARRVHRDWAQLCTATPHPARFDTSMVIDLPEPTRRYLTHAISTGTPLWQSVEVAMVGKIKLGGAWRPFTASQVIAPTRGYIWAASTRLFGVPVIGYDRLSGETAEMRWRLLDVLPVVNADGSDVARSAAGRLASEIALIPTAFPDAAWTAAGPDTAVASLGTGEDQQRVELHLSPTGQLRDLLIRRWGNLDGKPFGRYPFGVTSRRTHRRRRNNARGVPGRMVARNRPPRRRRVPPRPDQLGDLPMSGPTTLQAWHGPS